MKKREKINLFVSISALTQHRWGLELLLDSGVDIDGVGTTDYEGYALGYTQRTTKLQGTALEAAAFNGNMDNLELLLDRGANVNGGGVTALRAAAESHQEAAVRLLLDRGAETNTRRLYYNMLVAAVSGDNGGSENIVRLLLDRGADINAGDGFSGNALQNAVSSGNEDLLRLLLDKGADVNACRQYGGSSHYTLPFRNPLYRAIKDRKDIALVKLLIDKRADVNLRYTNNYDNKSYSAIAAAASVGSEDIVRLLLDRGANVNADCDYWGNTLRAAAFSGNESIVRLVLEKGAEDNANSDIDSFLQSAVKGGNINIVKLALDRGANVNERPVEGISALHNATFVRGGNEDIVRLLLDKGAEIHGYGLIHAAVRCGNENIVRLLLDRGADINERSAHNNSVDW